MEGVIELAEEIFNMPVRLGLPQNVRGLKDIVSNPIYSTGVGLLLYAMKHKGVHKAHHFDSEESGWNKLKGWFSRNF